MSTRCAFVSTNSITQGEQVAPLWKNLRGCEIDFAYRTFKWTFDGIRLNGHVNLYVTDGTTLTLPNGFASVTAPNNNSGRVSGLYYRGGTIDVGSGAQTIAGGAWYFYPSVAYAFPNDLTIDGGAAIGSSSYWEMASLSNGASSTSRSTVV